MISLNRIKISKITTLFLMLFILIILVILSSMKKEEPPVLAEKGILDLRSWDFESAPVLSLDGEWFLFPHKTGDEIPGIGVSRKDQQYVSIPSYMTSPLIPEKGRFGLNSFALRIILPDNPPDFLALALLNVTPNYELMVNGKIVTSAGRVNRNPRFSKTGNQTFMYPLKEGQGVLDIVLTISNYHNIAGGVNRSIHLGDYHILSSLNYKQILVDSFALGAIFIIAVYNLFLFSINRSRKSNLYLGLICLMAFSFAGMKEQMVLLRIFPFFEGEFRSKLIYLALCNSGGMIYFYSKTLYPHNFSEKFKTFYMIFMPMATLFILLTPMSVYSLFILPLEVLGLGSLFLVFITTLIKSLKKGWNDISPIILVIFVFCLTIFAGILDDAILLPLSSVSIVFLIVILSLIFSQALEYNRHLHRLGKLEGDQEELTRMNQELLIISQVDSLTSVANRRRFDQQLLALWEADKFMDKPVGLIMVDIDHFKSYNDHYGHQMGDSCLVKVAASLKNGLLRQSDFIARYGGEEFAIILSDMDAEGVHRVAENLRLSVESQRIPHEASASDAKIITVSLGCSVLTPGHNSSLRELISQADKALYDAKHRGRNQYRFYSQADNEENQNIS